MGCTPAFDTDEYCSDCKSYAQTVFDRCSGDTVCADCGLVLEAWYIDPTSEWRNFADDDSGGNRERVGDAVDPFLNGGGLGALIEKGTELSKMAARKQQQADSDKSLITAFSTLAHKAERLGLKRPILDRAKEIYKMADDKNFCKRRKDDALTAACLFLACQEEGEPRTLKEISYSAAGGSNMKEISKMKEQLKRVVEISGGTFTHAEDLTSRSCAAAGMGYKEKKAVNETLDKLKEFDIRRNPKSVLAAVMYMVVQVSNGLPGVKEVSQAADVAVGTTRKTYKDLYPYASRILPSWFANLEDIKKLRVP